MLCRLRALYAPVLWHRVPSCCGVGLHSSSSSSTSSTTSSYCTPNPCFQEGELALLIEPHRRREKPARLIKLESSKKTEIYHGHLSHADIIGREVGIRTNRFTIRRPSLEEYTKLMLRGPTPTYPEIIYPALCMMDIGSGSSVLEAGSGSGSMALHLSKIVGSMGRVLSFEVNPNHLAVARQNVATWTESWNLSRTQTESRWPDNICFYSAGVEEARDYLDNCQDIDGVFLDLPQSLSVLPTVVDLLRSSAVLVLFLPNITQTAEADAFIRSHKLALETEQIVEISQRKWTVKPSHTKHVSNSVTDGENSPHQCSHIDNSDDEGIIGDGEGSKVATMAPLSYICRPSHRQVPHTGELPLVSIVTNQDIIRPGILDEDQETTL